MTGLLVTVVVAAGCVVLAGVAIDRGHPGAAGSSPAQDRQLAALSAGNDPFADRRAVIAARATATKSAKTIRAGDASAKAKAKTRKLATARTAARRARQHGLRTVALTRPVKTDTPATATATNPTVAPPTSSRVEASTAAASGTGGSTAAGGSSSLPPGPTGIGSTQGSNCNPKCS